MEKFIATLLSLTVLIQITPTVSAKPKGNWNSVIGPTNHSIAVETTSGQTQYGLLQSADNAVIVVQIAGTEDFTTQEVTVPREEVRKLWRAKLRFGEKNIAKGAWVGAGVGTAATVVTLSAVAGKENADRALGVAWLPLLGAGTGAIVGVFWKKKHKKQELVYSI